MVNVVAKDLLEGKKYPTDLLVVILWAIIAAIGSLALPDGNIARIILGIPLLLFIPGYCLVSALWPEGYKEMENGEHKGINALERVAISFGLSLAVVSLVGLGLNFTPFEITLHSVIVSNFGINLFFTIFAWYRRNLLDELERFHVDFTISRQAFPKEPKERIMTVIIAISLILSVIMLAYVLLTPSPGENFTEFYILDDNGTTNNYPVNIIRNETTTVIVGIVCHENRLLNYTLVAGFENTNEPEYNADWNQPLNLTNGVGYARNITLNNGDVFEEPFNFYINNTGSYRIIWQLYIDNVLSDYKLSLNINVLP